MCMENGRLPPPPPSYATTPKMHNYYPFTMISIWTLIFFFYHRIIFVSWFKLIKLSTNNNDDQNPRHNYLHIKVIIITENYFMIFDCWKMWFYLLPWKKLYKNLKFSCIPLYLKWKIELKWSFIYSSCMS